MKARVVAGAWSSSAELDRLIDGQVHHVAADLSDPAGPQHLTDRAAEHGPVKVLVINVGTVSTRVDGFVAITDEQWTRSLNLTLMAASG